MKFLDDSFLSEYKTKEVNWGFPTGPNSVGEITYLRTYSRNEEWWQTCRRVVEGVYEILQNHCNKNNLPFDLVTAKFDAEQMYELIFDFKFLPPGRGLWMMGTDYVKERGGAALNNCGFVSTENIDKDFADPFRFLMDMSMLGVGVGFDTRGDGKLVWHPNDQGETFVIPDSREGWVEAMAAVIEWGFGLRPQPVFDGHLVRKAGEPIKGFGGVSEGPKPLYILLHNLKELIISRQGEKISSRDITDIMNMIGVCVVSGNVRRTAEIAFGEIDDDEFANLKNYEQNPDRIEYGWVSNNSVFAEVGMDYSRFLPRIASNGEPGFLWLDNAQTYGRMAESPNNKDYRARGANPCVEQTLEPYELCCLVETFPHKHASIEEYNKTLKYAFIYAKAVTLLPTHWKKTNAVMLRNRRIGTSMSGVAQFIAYRGKKELISWASQGYATILHYDRVYSEWLCIRESIKVTSVKPSGSVSLLAGATPGMHDPKFKWHIRRMRFSERHPYIPLFKEAGYVVEPSIVGYNDNKPVYDNTTVVVEFPTLGDPNVPTEGETGIEDKISRAVLLQKWWADNQVSCTVSFDRDTEAHLIPELLSKYDKDLKGISFLPIDDNAYPQMPYEAISVEQYVEMTKNLKKIDFPGGSVHDLQDAFCDGAACELKL